MLCEKLKVGNRLDGNRMITDFTEGAIVLTDPYGHHVYESNGGEPCKVEEVSKDRSILGGCFVCHRCGTSFTVKPTSGR